MEQWPNVTIKQKFKFTEWFGAVRPPSPSHLHRQGHPLFVCSKCHQILNTSGDGAATPGKPVLMPHHSHHKKFLPLHPPSFNSKPLVLCLPLQALGKSLYLFNNPTSRRLKATISSLQSLLQPEQSEIQDKI